MKHLEYPNTCSMLLFGSSARGDAHKGSDIDLLCMVEDPIFDLVRVGNIMMSIYGVKHIEAMCRQSSLFIWHLVSEGRMIFDRSGVLSSILKKFELKSDYSQEIYEATLMGWLLFSKGIESASINTIMKTYMYAVRTISYGLLAKDKHPCFSLCDASKYLDDSDLSALWEKKGNKRFSDINLNLLKSTLLKYGGGAPPPWVGLPLEELIHETSLPQFVRKRCHQLHYKIDIEYGGYS